MTKKSGTYLNQYDEFAEEYMNAQNEFYAKFPDESRKALNNQINFPLKDKKVLDVGCGFGKDLSYLEKEGALVYGIDASKKMIELARKNNPRLVNLSVQSFERTSFENHSFDVIISRYTLHYAENLKEAFKELHRILKPRGFLIFLVAHPLLAFVAKKERNYHKREIVEIPLFESKFIVREPSHTFSEYLNKFILENFEIISLYESPGLENKPLESSIKEIVPDFLLIKLRKK